MKLHSSSQANPMASTAGQASNATTVVSESDVGDESAVLDRPIGEIIRQTNQLTADQVEQVLAYQRERGIRFGEAAIALGLATGEDVLWALSQQFHYPYAADQRNHLHDELVVAKNPFSFRSEAFRAIRSQLMMRVFTADMPHRAVAVVSPDSGDGKTYFAANMAIAFSQLGGRTLLVDADMRSPRQHDLFGIDNATGLSGILSGRTMVNVIRPVNELPSLFVLPVGAVPPNPLELVERPAFALLMRELTSKFDYVVVDTPAYTHGADAPVIAARCGAVLAIAREGKSKMTALHDLVDALRETPAKLCGVIMNEF
jgi:protein-tyrosine kinase